MDEAARTGGPAVTPDRKRGPEEIRADIEHTRAQLGETVEALAAKTDVKAHARAKVEETKARALHTLATVKERVGGPSHEENGAAPATGAPRGAYGAPAAGAGSDAVAADAASGPTAAGAGTASSAADGASGPPAAGAGTASSAADGASGPPAAGGGTAVIAADGTSRAGRDLARTLRAHPELFGYLAAFAAGILAASLLRG